MRLIDASLPPSEIQRVCREYLSGIELSSKKKIDYYNIPCAFDIETSSWYEYLSAQAEKRACMYVWMLGLNGAVILGRYWDEFVTCIDAVSKYLKTSYNKRLIIYVHNLEYEFQFICRRFNWKKIFAIKDRRPLYALTDNGIEFRCSYMLSGMSLANVGKDLIKYKVQKMEGFLDYKLIRHSETPLTARELRYCINDVLVVMAYIQERIEADGGIANIPLTKTGYVRNYCRQQALYGGFERSSKEGKKCRYDYRYRMKFMQLEKYEYSMLKDAFAGGFTHASWDKSNKLHCNVRSYDFTSSYPACMVAEKYPIGKGEFVEISGHETERLEKYFKKYCCLFHAEFHNIREKVTYEHIISRSKCWGVEDEITDNGRIIMAKKLHIMLTEQDYYNIRDFYEWDEMKIGDFIRYRKQYLPKTLVKSFLELYKQKTELKDIEGQEVPYALFKAMLNSAYGMTVTDIFRPVIDFEDQWVSSRKRKPTETVEEYKVRLDKMFEDEINKYNKAPDRFLFYPWGVWITAYARRNLFTAILALGEDYIYSDTDSVKVLHAERHTQYFQDYNEQIIQKLKDALSFHDLPVDYIFPKNNKGKVKPLGIWSDEGEYQYFKTLGAKRYMTYKDGELSFTVSGLNKKTGVPYILEQCDNDILKCFDFFSHGMYIPPEHTGKAIHTYLDHETQGVVQDYLGNFGEYHEFSSIHLEDCDYHLKLSSDYARLLLGQVTVYK